MTSSRILLLLKGLLGSSARLEYFQIEDGRISRITRAESAKPPFRTTVAAGLVATGDAGINGKHITTTDQGGSKPMTSGRNSQMSKVKDFSKLALDVPTTTRPSLTNQQSNSLPSTPYQHTRSLSFRSRSPSPEQVDGNESPRSVKSELDSGVRSRAKGPLVAGCIYETGMAFSRRRVPYSIGGDQLERPTKIPKKYLTPVEEGKLSGDMRELYDRILPRRENDVKRAKFVQKLERILNDQWPGNNIKVHVFGSSGNMLYTSDSDSQYH